MREEYETQSGSDERNGKEGGRRDIRWDQEEWKGRDWERGEKRRHKRKKRGWNEILRAKGRRRDMRKRRVEREIERGKELREEDTRVIERKSALSNRTEADASWAC